MRVHYRDIGDLDIENVSPLTAEGMVSESQTIHTIIAQPRASWLIVEGALATIGHSRHVNHCYSRKSRFQLSTTPELYQPMSEACLKAAEDDLGEVVKWKVINLGIINTLTACV